MKKLFCTVVTDWDGTLDSPIIYHTRAENPDQVAKHIAEELEELGYEPEQQADTFDVFTFEVRDLDIQEL